MNNYKQKLWVMGTVASLSLFGGLSTQALDYGFDLVFDSGPLNGQSFQGSLTVDPSQGTADPSLPGATRFSPLTGFLALDVTVDGVAFGINNDLGFPFFPITVVLTSLGTILEMDFISSPVLGAELDIRFNRDVNFVTFTRSANSDPSWGEFVQRTVVPPPVSIPDSHASAILLLASFAGLRWWSRRG